MAISELKRNFQAISSQWEASRRVWNSKSSVEDTNGSGGYGGTRHPHTQNRHLLFGSLWSPTSSVSKITCTAFPDFCKNAFWCPKSSVYVPLESCQVEFQYKNISRGFIMRIEVQLKSGSPPELSSSF